MYFIFILYEVHFVFVNTNAKYVSYLFTSYYFHIKISLDDKNEKRNKNTQAKEAGISTGCLYDYFIDKKDIFIEVLDKYSNILIHIVFKKFEETPQEEALLNVIKRVINILIQSHDFSKNFHEEVMALSHLDADVRKYFKLQQQVIMNKILDQLKKRKTKNVSYSNCYR